MWVCQGSTCITTKKLGRYIFEFFYNQLSVHCIARQVHWSASNVNSFLCMVGWGQSYPNLFGYWIVSVFTKLLAIRIIFMAELKFCTIHHFDTKIRIVRLVALS